MASVSDCLRIVEVYRDEQTGKEFLKTTDVDLFDFPEIERRGVLAGHDSSDEIPCVWADWADATGND